MDQHDNIDKISIFLLHYLSLESTSPNDPFSLMRGKLWCASPSPSATTTPGFGKMVGGWFRPTLSRLPLYVRYKIMMYAAHLYSEHRWHICFRHYNASSIPQKKLSALREFCRNYFYLIDMSSDLKRNITALINQIFPAFETLFSFIFYKSALAVLSQYLTL